MKMTVANILRSLLPVSSSSLLRLLVAIVDQHEHAFLDNSRTYYSYLSSLLTNTPGTEDKDLILTAIRIPLAGRNC